MSVFTDAISDTSGKFRVTITTMIPSGQSESGPVYLGNGMSLVGLKMADAWTAAPLQFSASPDGVTWYNMCTQAGAPLSIAGALQVNYLYGLDYYTTLPWRWVKIRSGPPGGAVNQTANRTLKLICKAIA